MFRNPTGGGFNHGGPRMDGPKHRRRDVTHWGLGTVYRSPFLTETPPVDRGPGGPDSVGTRLVSWSTSRRTRPSPPHPWSGTMWVPVGVEDLYSPAGSMGVWGSS